MNTLSNERLEQLAVEEDMYNFCPEHEELNALARELLALRKEREAAVPVAVVDIQRGRGDGRKYALCYTSLGHSLPDDVYNLYTAPPAQPVAVPDAICVRQAIANMEKHEYSDTTNVAYKQGWNDCRAAMLKQPASNEGQP